MSLITILATAIASILTALIAALITYTLTRRREHEADWRKLKLAQYQEYVLALSGVVRERATPASQRRYSDAVNSMNLVAPISVLRTLENFQAEISFANKTRSDERHDILLDILFKSMRNDIHPDQTKAANDYQIHLLGLPPEAQGIT